MTSEKIEQRIMQGGLPVAQVSGDRSFVETEIGHYAFHYQHDGPIEIQERNGRKWKTLRKEQQWQNPPMG